MANPHVAAKNAGANAHERQAIPVPRIHVGLNLENERGKPRIFWRDDALLTQMRRGRRGMIEKSF